MYLLHLLLNCLLLKNVHVLKKKIKYVVIYFNIFIFLAIIIDISIIIYFFLKFIYSSLQLLLLYVSELIFISSYVSYV